MLTDANGWPPELILTASFMVNSVVSRFPNRFTRVARKTGSVVAVPCGGGKRTNDTQYGRVTKCKNAVELKDVKSAVPTIMTWPKNGTEPVPRPANATTGIPIMDSIELPNDTRRNQTNRFPNSPL